MRLILTLEYDGTPFHGWAAQPGLPTVEAALRAALAASAAAVVGEHDFRAFTPTQTQHKVFVRVVERAEWIRRGDHLDFEITAGSYLRHMVRSLVGTMVESPDSIPALLAGRVRSEAGATAPPWGLYLVSVAY